MRSWRAFATGALLVLGALALVTWRVFELEGRERIAVESARAERLVGEALLRMDLAVLPLLAAEAARPRSEWAAPPTLIGSESLFRRRFSIAPDGAVTASDTAAAELPIDRLRAAAPPVLQSIATWQPNTALPQQNVDTQSYAGRRQFVDNYNATNGNPIASASEPVGVFAAVFVDPEGQVGAGRDGSGAGDRLFFVRRAGRGGAVVEGIEADWSTFTRWLVEQNVDLLPNARLRPLGGGEADATRRLASLPAVLEPGLIPAPDPAPASPLPWLLLTIWSVVLAALGVVGFAVHAATALSERRARFVSSVTHELRTPLTTFRMYTQMLADGMVPAGKREDYLATLRNESERLVRIVESVLLYSRLEGHRGGARRVDAQARALAERVQRPLEQRCREARQQLVTAIEVGDGARVCVDPQAVEQILVNLVDNACKYAPGAPIHFRARATDRELVLSVADQGPGIPENAKTRIFEAFHRGDAQRTGATPGLGLGLAIASELAAAAGGQLVLQPAAGDGATFVLRLPLTRPEDRAPRDDS